MNRLLYLYLLLRFFIFTVHLFHFYCLFLLCIYYFHFAFITYFHCICYFHCAFIISIVYTWNRYNIARFTVPNIIFSRTLLFLFAVHPKMNETPVMQHFSQNKIIDI
jgi:hypothetical protein